MLRNNSPTVLWAVLAVLTVLLMTPWVDARQTAKPFPATSAPQRTAPKERPRPISSVIAEANPSAEVDRLLSDGHTAIYANQSRASFDDALKLFRQALQKARERKEKKSEEVARWLIGMTEKAIARYNHAQVEAKRDAAQGKLVYKDWGMPPPEIVQRHRAALTRKYGIQCEDVAGCDPTYDEIAEALGNNIVSIAAIEKKYGKDFWDIFWGRKPIPDDPATVNP